MSQKRNIKDFFKKAPAQNPTTLPDKTMKNQQNSTSSSSAASIAVAAISQLGSTMHPSTSSSLSSVPNSSLLQQGQPKSPGNRSVSPPATPTVDSGSEDGKSSPSSISSIHVILPSQTPFLPKGTIEPPSASSNIINSRDRIIKNSDDEEDNSDSDSLPDLFATSKPKGQANEPKRATAPITPPRPSRGRKQFSFHSSPLTVQPKYAFDLRALQKQSRIDAAAEETAKRLKTMMEPSQEADGDSVMSESVTGDDEIVNQEELVDMLVGDLEEEEAEKQKAVLKRTQTTLTEMRYYFFNTQSKSGNEQCRESQLSESPRPRSSTAESWIFDCVCGNHGKIDDGALSIACDTCNRWQHSKCVNISRAVASRRNFIFICNACKEKKENGERAKYERPGSTFPLDSIMEDWEKELSDPRMRYQTFISGFAENMVGFGRALPDELFIWLLDEICFEVNDLLRNSYCGVLEKSPNQIYRLLAPEAVQHLFRHLGGTPGSTSLTERIRPVEEVPDPYPKQEWANLRSVVKLLGRVAQNLRQKTREYTICILLRMAADNMVMNNVDLLSLVHETITSLCCSVPHNVWETCCQKVCRSLFTSVEQASLRFQITKCIPSTISQTQDLKRRSAAASFFEDISFCDRDTYLNNDINRYTNYLNKPLFKINKNSDFQDIAARISLLDIAIDDGKYAGLDLNDQKTIKEHNKDIEILGARVRAIWQAVPNNISATLHRKIEAKVAMDVVGYRILHTLRIPTKAKPKKDLFSLMRGHEDLEGEKTGMAKFLIKKKPPKMEVDDLEDVEDGALAKFLEEKQSMGL